MSWETTPTWEVTLPKAKIYVGADLVREFEGDTLEASTLIDIAKSHGIRKFEVVVKTADGTVLRPAPNDFPLEIKGGEEITIRALETAG